MDSSIEDHAGAKMMNRDIPAQCAGCQHGIVAAPAAPAPTPRQPTAPLAHLTASAATDPACQPCLRPSLASIAHLARSATEQGCTTTHQSPLPPLHCWWPPPPLLGSASLVPTPALLAPGDPALAALEGLARPQRVG
eukprot:1138926-Pelagomonas_calceolata.AAC.10